MSEPTWELLGGGGVIGGPIDYVGAWAAGVTYQPGQIVRYQGVDYLCVNPALGQTPPAARSSLVASYGTSFPASPYDGQEAILVDSVTNPSYIWRFRYNAGSTSAYKWEFVGGSPFHAVDGGNFNTTGANVWHGSTSTDFIAPRAGDYDCVAEAQFGTPVANQNCYLAVADASISNNPDGGQWGMVIANYDTIVAMPRIANVGAGQTLRMVFNTPIVNVAISMRVFRVLPKRLS